jgi:hypothetical protein
VTPAQIIALIRDTALVAGVSLILWFVYRGGEDRVKAADLKGLQDELHQMAQISDRWHQESTDANAQLAHDMAAIHAAASVQRPSVLLCDQPAASASLLPGTAAAPAPASAGGGGAVAGSRGDSVRDIRPQLEAFKLKYESALAGCRAALASWPE